MASDRNTDKRKEDLASAYYVDYGQLMLAIVLATIPIIIVFLTMQKQFVEGIVGSSK